MESIGMPRDWGKAMATQIVRSEFTEKLGEVASKAAKVPVEWRRRDVGAELESKVAVVRSARRQLIGTMLRRHCSSLDAPPTEPPRAGGLHPACPACKHRGLPQQRAERHGPPAPGHEPAAVDAGAAAH